jgi:hypothetical protein
MRALPIERRQEHSAKFEVWKPVLIGLEFDLASLADSILLSSGTEPDFC